MKNIDTKTQSEKLNQFLHLFNNKAVTFPYKKDTKAGHLYIGIKKYAYVEFGNYSGLAENIPEADIYKIFHELILSSDTDNQLKPDHVKISVKIESRLIVQKKSEAYFCGFNQETYKRAHEIKGVFYCNSSDMKYDYTLLLGGDEIGAIFMPIL